MERTASHFKPDFALTKNRIRSCVLKLTGGPVELPDGVATAAAHWADSLQMRLNELPGPAAYGSRAQWESQLFVEFDAWADNMLSLHDIAVDVTVNSNGRADTYGWFRTEGGSDAYEPSRP